MNEPAEAPPGRCIIITVPEPPGLPTCMVIPRGAQAFAKLSEPLRSSQTLGVFPGWGMSSVPKSSDPVRPLHPGLWPHQVTGGCVPPASTHSSLGVCCVAHNARMLVPARGDPRSLIGRGGRVRTSWLFSKLPPIPVCPVAVQLHCRYQSCRLAASSPAT